MYYFTLAITHLVTVLPCFLIGIWIFSTTKGTSLHKRLGRIYVVLIMITALITLAMPAEVGPRLLDHFGFIHGFSLLVLVQIPVAVSAIRHGNVGTHRRAMVGVYAGGILIAGTFALAPGRLLHTWLLG